MASIDLSSTGPDDRQWLLAKPGLHWKYGGASGMALADAWGALMNGHCRSRMPSRQ